uniref:F-box domain-containing protein n=1 Tax=Moschus moschiferus TaxID=68415 RepID=A0A8C6CME7_MOSMO
MGSPAAAAWPGEDDLWASRGLPASVATLYTEPEEVLDLNRLPNELLQEVLSYLPPSTLLRHCRPVCRRWRDLVDGWDLWRSILPWKHPDLWPVIRTCLPPADDPGPCILGRFCERRPVGRNLLRSPRGLGGEPRKGSLWKHVGVAKGAGTGKTRRSGRLLSTCLVLIDLAPSFLGGVNRSRCWTWRRRVCGGNSWIVETLRSVSPTGECDDKNSLLAEHWPWFG